MGQFGCAETKEKIKAGVAAALQRPEVKAKLAAAAEEKQKQGGRKLSSLTLDRVKVRGGVCIRLSRVSVIHSTFACLAEITWGNLGSALLSEAWRAIMICAAGHRKGVRRRRRDGASASAASMRRAAWVLLLIVEGQAADALFYSFFLAVILLIEGKMAFVKCV